MFCYSFEAPSTFAVSLPPSSIVFLLLDIDFYSAADSAAAIVENTEAAGPGRREQERKAASSLWDVAKQRGGGI